MTQLDISERSHGDRVVLAVAGIYSVLRIAFGG